MAAANERSRIQLCGRLSVEIDGVQLTGSMRGKQVPLLFAYMALHRDRHIGRDELSNALWPAQAPNSEDAALRTLLSRLRSGLGSSVVVGRDQLTLALPEPVWIDVEAAATGIGRAQEALDLGDARTAWALAQVPLNISGRGLLPGAQASWLEPRRRELEDLRLQALELIGRAGLMLGGSQLQSVERAARSLIEGEPYRESGYVLLMQALAAEGNIGEGLRVFERLRTLLRDELGTAPSPETIAAHDRLLRPAADRQPSLVGHGAGIEFPPGLARDSPMVGRAAELAELEGLWSIGPGSTGLGPPAWPITLLVGDPGIGKTRLAAEAARRVHEVGAIVLAGRASQEALVPYQPILEALRHYISNAPLDQLRSTVREYGSDLARLVPELRRRLPGLPPAIGEPETERYRLFEAVAGVLAEIAATTPLLLVLDDLHWADRPTLLLLRHIARVARPHRSPILGAYRASEAEREGPFADALSELRQEQLVREILIGGLSQDETAELVRATIGTIPPLTFVRALERQTEGNPLFVSQILRELRQGGTDFSTVGPSELRALGLPEDVRRVISYRLGGLGKQTLEWLRSAAVIGREFDASLLERVVSLGEEQFIAALEEALAVGVVREPPRPASPYALRESSGRYSFAHVLIRETLYEEMSAVRRARIHRRVGEVLEQLGAEDEDGPEELAAERVAMLAQHFTSAASAQDAEKAIGYARQAGEQARQMLAYEEAAGHFARALGVLDRFKRHAVEQRLELLLSLAEAYVLGGDRPLAWRPLREASDLAIRLSDPDSLGRAAIAASRRYVQQPGVVDEELISLLDRALEMTEGEVSTGRVRLLARMCGALYYSPDRARMAELSAEAERIAAQLGDPEASALAAAARRRAFWEPSRLQERLKDASELLRYAGESGDIELMLQGHAWLVVDLLELGDLDAVDTQIAAFSEGAGRLRQPLYLWQAGVWGAMRALLAGRIEQADQLASEALAAGARAEDVTAGQYYAAQLLAIRREQARMAELEPAVRNIIEAYPNRVAYRAALSLLLSETGRPDEAQSELEFLAEDGFAGVPDDLDWLTAMALLADVCAELGDQPVAERMYELLLPYAGVNVVIGLAVVCEGAAARHLGRLAAVVGRSSDAAEHFEQALERNQALTAPVCLARTQLDYAQALGSGARARALIDAASRSAGELELTALGRRASALRDRI